MLGLLHEFTEDRLQHVHDKLSKIDKDMYIEIDEQEKERLRYMYKPVLEKAKFHLKRYKCIEWFKIQENIFNKLAINSLPPDNHKACLVGTSVEDEIYLPPPIQDSIDQLYNIIENEMLQILHGMINSSNVTDNEIDPII